MIGALRTRLRRLAQDSESGQAMVEFVIVFPVQLLLTLAIIQFAFLAHAYIVVSQAAFMGARAGAVADMQDGVSLQDAGRRAAARLCALLTSGDSRAAGTVPPDGALEWSNSTGRYGFDAAHQQEAYGLLTTETEAKDGYVVCDVTFDYILSVPIGNRLLSVLSFDRGAHKVQGLTTFRLNRVAYLPTPWTVKPVD